MARKTESDPRRKPKEAMEQSALRLPVALREQLKRAGGEGGMGEEIRRRLEASFEAEQPSADPRMRELLDAIAFVADKTAMYWGPWSEDPFAFAVLKAYIDLLLTARRPKGEAVQKPKKSDPGGPSGFEDVLFGADATPETVARFILSNWLWAKRAGNEKSSK